MFPILRSRITLVWAILAAATLLSFESALLGSPHIAQALILVIAFAKTLAIGREFMELRHAPAWLLWLFQGWAVATCIALLVLTRI